MDDSVKLTIRLPREFLEEIDFLVAVDDFSSRSDAIRTAVRDMLYDRTPMVMDKAKKKVELRRQLADMEMVKQQYLQK